MIKRSLLGSTTCLGIIALLGISGCSSTSNEAEWGTATTVDEQMLTAQAQVTHLHRSDIDNLENLTPGAQRELIYPLWGADATQFVVNDRYFSALGRVCLRVTFAHRGNNLQANALQRGVICPTRNGWGVTADLRGVM